MFYFPPTVILRHQRENLNKCSLRGLESREDLIFLTYPKSPLPDLSHYCLLTIGAPLLTESDRDFGLFLIDGTWRHAKTMAKIVPPEIRQRSLPLLKTAYPRRQDDCPDPNQGLASVEALYVAYQILGRKAEGLLDHYYWKDQFLENSQSVTIT
jgi:pre-rRNA-processing protein TSR3